MLPYRKSEAIRNYKGENPTVGPNRITSALNVEGYDVTTQFVSTVLSNDRRKHGLVNRKKSADDLSISDLQFANELVDWLGGVENAIIAINAYSQLISS
ncbi:hypothetical protein N8550_03790 [Pirellulaceae bacterium]|nr:hypothetical protein [Pirellulaceae bacterium]